MYAEEIVFRMLYLLVPGRVTRKYPHLVLIPALSSGRVLVLNAGTRPGTSIYNNYYTV